MKTLKDFLSEQKEKEELPKKLHDEYYSYFGNDVIDLRSKIEVNLKNDIKNYYSNWEAIIKAL